MTPEERIAYNAKKKEYRENMPEYQKLKYLEYLKKTYHSLTPEKKAKLLEKRKANYEKNKDKKREYQRIRYQLTKDKKND